MSISARTSKGICRLRVAEEMNIYNAAAMKEALLTHLAGCSELEINLSKVSEMDTAGLQLLYLVKREAAQQGKTVRLAAHSPATLEILDSYNMAACFGDPVVMPQAARTSQG
ncbi:MAG: STAS domain-containing protein [Pseudomonadota bacterium]|jgi:anti-anti-sigma factor